MYAVFGRNLTVHKVEREKTYGYKTWCGRTGTPAPIFYDDLPEDENLSMCMKCLSCTEKEEPVEPAIFFNLMYLPSDLTELPEYAIIPPRLLEMYRRKHMGLVSGYSSNIQREAESLLRTLEHITKEDYLWHRQENQ